MTSLAGGNLIVKSIWCLVILWGSRGLAAEIGSDAPGNIAPNVAAALSDRRRPVQQVALDVQRKPAQVIAFAQLKAGDKVGDFMPGNGYFTRILSDLAGPGGHVYAFNPTQQLAHCPPWETAGSRAIARDPQYANVTVLTAPVEDFRAPEKLDVLWTAQNYHDLHDAFMGPADVAALNRAFFAALKPGGVFLVIDHVAEPGSGLRDTETLHRIDPLRMQQEIEAAGFVLEAQSPVLRNPGDNHRLSVFNPLLRGRTDQVVLRFRKPKRP